MKSRTLFLGALIAASQIRLAPARSAAGGPKLTVDAAADRHPISPDIYGMNDNPFDPGLAQEIGLPVSRWGGDATTRYNWQVDASNAGDDWFFMAGGDNAHPVPSGSADRFVQKAKAAGGKALLTIPIIDFINKAAQWNCSFPVSLYGPQQKTNPYVHPVVNGAPTDAGNGRKPDGTPIVLDNAGILRVHVPNSPAFQQGWVRHLMQKFGPASRGGVAIYEMDNEPSGWANTHRDVHPNPPTYDEILDKTLAYARAVKRTDPSAKIDGPGDFGWPAYRGEPEKRGGLWNAEYYLKRMSEASRQDGSRLLDYFDEHYYPTSDDGAGGLALSPAGNAATQALRLQSTRSLWDPTYVEKNWIGKYYGAIRLIPRMRAWVDKYDPGTRLAITEYNWGGLESINGALAEADVLGIFGRERLDLATLWGPPKPDEPGAFAFRIYRNYDGVGGRYGETWVRSQSGDPGKLAIYGALRQSDGALTLMVLNKTGQDLESDLSLSGFLPRGTARVYRYGPADLQAIVREADQPATASGFSAVYPANSITLVVLGPRKSPGKEPVRPPRDRRTK
jgi:hypothetical protein